MVCKYFSYLVGYLFSLDIIFWCICFLLLFFFNSQEILLPIFFSIVAFAFGVITNKSAVKNFVYQHGWAVLAQNTQKFWKNFFFAAVHFSKVQWWIGFLELDIQEG